ncbi:MAG TPA: LamG domain-containing protein [Sedimentisphaerales bacterium]|jgi:hypothetical protein|nr:LamG domain-containing protein [Sedimentisphaerales bacterium]HNU28990.1 LamG domain-containing protein [Sedimentisphaerales bacterium]
MCRRVVLIAVVGLVLGVLGEVRGQDPALVGWWKLDEGGGTVVLDSSGRGVHGTLFNPSGGLGTNGAVWVEDPDRGTVLSFNGNDTSGAYVTAGTIPALDLVKDFTWMFWCKQTSSGTGQDDVIIGNRYGGTASPLQFVKFTQRRFEYYNDDGSYVNSITYPTVMPNEVWVHNAAVKDGATLTYYRNGKKVLSSTLTKTMDANPFYIGGDPQGERWAGRLSDVRLYERALTADEVFQIGATLKASKPTPANGALAVDGSVPLLQWTAGASAAFHDVYLGDDPNLTADDLKGSRQKNPLYYHIAGFTAGATYYWRVDEIDKDGVTVYPGDTWTFTVRDMVAYHPTPADGSEGVSVAPTLTWLPALGAAGHRLYFGTDRTAVAEGAAAADQGAIDALDPNFAPGDLDSLTTYYWRVDTTVASGLQTGAVWSFTTCQPIDDFESYTDDEGNRIYEFWLDGFGDKSSGSMVGHFDAPFAEQVIVHGGSQSMPLDYNNINEPYYSEAQFAFDSAQDWTADGAEALVLWVRGAKTNSRQPLYLRIEDSSKKTGSLVHPDPSIVTTTQWTEWKIPLAEIPSVSLTRIKTIYIGVGDRANPQADGTGLIYIDDVGLTRSATDL